MSRLWICGICQNNEKEIEEILSPFSHQLSFKKHEPYALHTLWVDGGSYDNTLNTIVKHSGYYRERQWTNDHDFQMNEYLRFGLIEHGDWVIQLDTSERLHLDFISKLQNGMLETFEKQNINTVYQRSKPLLFKWHDDQIFLGSPHWGLQGQRRHMVDISKFDGFEENESYCWSLRDDIDKWITNGIKYYYVYGRSNHMYLVYNPANYPGTTENLIQQHEAKRMEFRNYCRNELSFSLANLDDITEYMKKGDFDAEFIKFMNFEKVIANYYRHLTGEDQKYIYDTQNEWKYEQKFWTCSTCKQTYRRRRWRGEWGIAACLSFVEHEEFNDCCTKECINS